MESDATIFQFSAASEAASGTALDCFQGQQGGVFSSIGLGDAPRARRDGCGLSARQGKRHHASIFSYFVPRSFDQKEAVRRPFRTHELVWLYHQPLRSWLMSAVASRLTPFTHCKRRKTIIVWWSSSSRCRCFQRQFASPRANWQVRSTWPSWMFRFGRPSS